MKITYVPKALIGEKVAAGSQEKWYDPATDCWNKADLYGYEGFAEALVSVLLEKSNIEKETPFTFVRYSPQKFNIRGANRTGCSSKNFLKKNQLLVTINGLFKKYYGTPLEQKLKHFSSKKNQLGFIAEQTKEITGLEQFDKYLTLLIETDALFLNTGRTFDNISVIYDLNEEKFLYSPIFNNGSALLSDMLNYPAEEAAEDIIPQCRALPMDTGFNRQARAINSLYGKVLKMPYITTVELSAIMLPILEYYPQSLRPVIADRVQKCLENRQTALQLL